MGTFFCVDGKIVVPREQSSKGLIAELQQGIVGPDGTMLTFADGDKFIDNIGFAWRDARTRWATITEVEPDEVERIRQSGRG
jgi:hypothetical protein